MKLFIFLISKIVCFIVFLLDFVYGIHLERSTLEISEIKLPIPTVHFIYYKSKRDILKLGHFCVLSEYLIDFCFV